MSKEQSNSGFSRLASSYKTLPPYPRSHIAKLVNEVGEFFQPIVVAEIGAGTGNFLETIRSLGVAGYAVEPNKAMARIGRQRFRCDHSFHWSDGRAEETGLRSSSVNWCVFANALQFVDLGPAMTEAHRILETDGFLTVMWRLRDRRWGTSDAYVSDFLDARYPHLDATTKEDCESIVAQVGSSGCFRDSTFEETFSAEEVTSMEYINAFRARNDVASQMSKEAQESLFRDLETLLKDVEIIECNWRTCSWTFRRI